VPHAQINVKEGVDSLDGGREAVRELLDSGLRPTAVICVNDLMAVGAMRELRARHLRIPQDVSVTGFDNIRLSEFCSPSLTTVHIPRDEIGRTIFQHLVPAPKRPRPREILVSPELIVRESSGPAPKS